MTDYHQLSETELRSLIEKAEVALKNKQINKRKEVIAQIKDLAASIDVTVDIHEHGRKATKPVTKLPVKYRHPNDPEKIWTGRGITPKWLKALLDQGHDLAKFKVN